MCCLKSTLGVENDLHLYLLKLISPGATLCRRSDRGDCRCYKKSVLYLHDYKKTGVCCALRHIRGAFAVGACAHGASGRAELVWMGWFCCAHFSCLLSCLWDILGFNSRRTSTSPPPLLLMSLSLHSLPVPAPGCTCTAVHP